MTYLGTSLRSVLSHYNYGRVKLIIQYLKFINTLQKKCDRDIFGGSTLPCRPCGTSQSCCRIWTDKLYIHIIAGDPFTVFFSAWKYAKLLAGQVLRKGPAERRAPCSSIGGAQTLLQFCQRPLPHLFALPLILSSACQKCWGETFLQYLHHCAPAHHLIYLETSAGWTRTNHLPNVHSLGSSPRSHNAQAAAS